MVTPDKEAITVHSPVWEAEKVAGTIAEEQEVAPTSSPALKIYLRRGLKLGKSKTPSPVLAPRATEVREDPASPANDASTAIESALGERVDYDYSSDDVFSTEAPSGELMEFMPTLMPSMLSTSLSLVVEDVPWELTKRLPPRPPQLRPRCQHWQMQHLKCQEV